MPSLDLISSSFITAWTDSDSTPLCPANRIYLDRPQQPLPLGAGFPYMAMDIAEIEHEVSTQQEDFNSLVTYRFTLEIWTCQGMTGGTSTGDQVTDMGNLQRGVSAILDRLPPNTGWNFLDNFLHCINEGAMTCRKDNSLYLGKDVLHSSQSWQILVAE